MHSKGELYIYKGPNIVEPVHRNNAKLNTLDIVTITGHNGNLYVLVAPLKVGYTGTFLVYVGDLLPYEEFPEDDPVDKRSIAFWNKIREHNLVFDKAFKSYD
jgi:hypothetical protein